MLCHQLWAPRSINNNTMRVWTEAGWGVGFFEWRKIDFWIQNYQQHQNCPQKTQEQCFLHRTVNTLTFTPFRSQDVQPLSSGAPSHQWEKRPDPSWVYKRVRCKHSWSNNVFTVLLQAVLAKCRAARQGAVNMWFGSPYIPFSPASSSVLPLSPYPK